VLAGRDELFSAPSATPTLKNIVGRRVIGVAVALVAFSVPWRAGGQDRLAKVAGGAPASSIGEEGRPLAHDTPSSGSTIEQAELTLTRELADYAKWQKALACLNVSSGCAALRCYDDYLAAPSPRAHGEQAKSARASLLPSCPAAAAALSPAAAPSVPIVAASGQDGRYLARSRGGCGTKPGSVTLTIAEGAISWRHEFQGQAYEWSGAIDASGRISASVGGAATFQANGRYSGLDREMTMKYPQCETEIPMSIISKLAN